MKDFKNKIVVITGAGSGIGRALAQQFATKGARLALSDVNAEGLAETLGLLPPNTDVRPYALNVTDGSAMFAHDAQCAVAGVKSR